MREALLNRPRTLALMIWALAIVVPTEVGILLSSIAPDWPEAAQRLAAEAVIVLMTAGLLTALQWWRPAGFVPFREWRGLRLLWLPGVVVVLPLVFGLRLPDSATLLILVLGYAGTGFHEEAIFRGMILPLLGRDGPWKAAIGSAVLFALSHIVRLVFGSAPALVAAQIVGAFCDGFAFAALRLRTGTIWPLIGLHFLHDLLLQLGALPVPVPVVDAVQVTILLVYGIVILRRQDAAAS